MLTENFSIKYDQKFSEWQKQSSIDPGLVTTAWRMVELALLDLRKKPEHNDYESAYKWIFGRQDFFYSFENMCDVIGMNAKLIRDKVKKYLDK